MRLVLFALIFSLALPGKAQLYFGKTKEQIKSKIKNAGICDSSTIEQIETKDENDLMYYLGCVPQVVSFNFDKNKKCNYTIFFLPGETMDKVKKIYKEDPDFVRKNNAHGYRYHFYSEKKKIGVFIDMADEENLMVINYPAEK